MQNNHSKVVQRILVEKKEPFRFGEKAMLRDIRETLGITAITNVRIFKGYDVDGVSDIEKATTMVFSEKGQDNVFYDEVDTSDATYVYAVTAAVGQYDQLEDMAMALLRIMEPDSDPTVQAFTHIALYGDISEAEYAKIKAYFINPLEKREIPTDKTYPPMYGEPDEIATITGFSQADEAQLLALAKTHGIAMNIQDLTLCRDYFAKEDRDPTETEMKVLDTYWSDHCRHSTFLAEIEDVQIEESKYSGALARAEESFKQAKDYVYGDSHRPLCLMDIATMEMKKQLKNGDLSDMERSDEVNACSIETRIPVQKRYTADGDKAKSETETDIIVMFKNETHNHPTEMEPFGGASTCLGGGIRDPLSGRSFVYGAMRITGSGDPREPVEETLQGKLPQRVITQTAATGYSSYGNGIGLASGHLVEYYDHGFKAKRMECGALVGVAEKVDIIRKDALPGDVIVLVGGRTGRDGCGGATGSSKEHDDDSLEKGGAEVQKGNPVIERNVVRLFRKPHVSKMIKKCNDFGAGGVCVAVGELADGLSIELDKVPAKYPGLSGTELAISESQERMAVVLSADNLEEFLAEADKENLEATKIATVTNANRVVMTWREREILNISREFLNCGGIRQKAKVIVSQPNWDLSIDKPDNMKSAWLKNLADLNVCSKQGIASRFDTTVGGATVFMPYGGANQKTPELGLAMRFPLRDKETDYGTVMTVGYNPKLCNKSPFHAALYAVIESVTKIAAMGGDYRKVRLSFQEYFEKLVDDKAWGKPYSALMGAFLAQDELGLPSIGGKDSMSGTFKDINVPPSLLSFAVAVVDTTKLVSRAFKSSDSKVYLLKTPIDEAGLPDFKVLKNNMESIYKLVQKDYINASSIVGAGGIAATVSEMAFGNNVGFSFAPEKTDCLFAPQYTSFIFELSDKVHDINDAFTEMGEKSPDFLICLGHTQEKQEIEIDGTVIQLSDALSAWEETLESVFPLEDVASVPTAPPSTKSALSEQKQSGKSANVLVPVFPGSTGEYDLEKQFERVGATVTSLVFRTKSAKDIKDSYVELAAEIDKADILAIPSGMSAGAEPDGSAKLIAMILRNPLVKTAVNKLIQERRGLVLGLGEGFKALLKVGLIQTGIVQDDEYDDIVLAKYPSNEYISTLDSIKVESVCSPWFANMSGEVEVVPISGKDGIIHISQELLDNHMNKEKVATIDLAPSPRELSAKLTEGVIGKWQIATRYTNEPHGIESLVSANGQILGRTGLVERLDSGLYANVFHAKPSAIFENAMDYISKMHA